MLYSQSQKKSCKSKFLTDEEHSQLFKQFSTGSYSLFTGIAQILESKTSKNSRNESIWSIQNTGILCFIKDHTKCTFFIKLFSMTDLKPVWQMECYIELNFKVPKQKFVTFDGLKTRIGVNFHCNSECYEFVSVVSERVCRRKLPNSVGMLCWNADLNTQNGFACPTQYTNSYTVKNH